MDSPRPPLGRRVPVPLLLVGLLFGSSYCGGKDDPTGPPPPGTAQVTVTTTGADQPASYLLTVTSSDGTVSASVSIAANGSWGPQSVPAGVTVTGTLGQIPMNCATPSASQTATSVSGQLVQVSFTVVCEALAGAIEVSASTDGDLLDADGYSVTVGSETADLDINGSVTFSDLQAGDYSVTLSGVDDMCGVGGESTRTVEVTLGATAQEEFQVACPMLFEDDFSVGDQWDTLSIFVTEGSGHAEENVATGGFEGGFRKMDHTVAGPGGVWVWHRFEGGSYVPATLGAVSEINYSEYHRKIVPDNEVSAIGAHVGIEQDGHVYRVGFPGSAFTSTVWELGILSELAAEVWVLAPRTEPDPAAPAHPDFSENGAEIFLGFIRANSSPNEGTGTVTHGIDNWRMVIHRTPLGG